tara:strand:- start:1320 stop:1550 length:231 start_codon:yes stop_codon:yes gene_type:complete
METYRARWVDALEELDPITLFQTFSSEYGLVDIKSVEGSNLTQYSVQANKPLSDEDIGLLGGLGWEFTHTPEAIET